MKIQNIALQLYTVRSLLQTPAEIAETLKKVRAIGYQAIQVSGMGPIPEEDLVAICQGEGLTICATHEPAPTILDDPAAVVDRLGRLGCPITAYPYPKDIDFADSACVQGLIDKLNAAGEVLAKAGQTLLYHNHAHEFLKVGGKTILEHIYDSTDPKYLGAEIDTYWVQYGGESPEGWCKKMSGRLPVLHCKDYAIESPAKPNFTEVGQGNLNWPAIVAAAEGAGCEWFVVEQDTCPGDPLESARKSFEYLKATFVD